MDKQCLEQVKALVLHVICWILATNSSKVLFTSVKQAVAGPYVIFLDRLQNALERTMKCSNCGGPNHIQRDCFINLVPAAGGGSMARESADPYSLLPHGLAICWEPGRRVCSRALRQQLWSRLSRPLPGQLAQTSHHRRCGSGFGYYLVSAAD